jgi:hypothetical protein
VVARPGSMAAFFGGGARRRDHESEWCSEFV